MASSSGYMNLFLQGSSLSVTDAISLYIQGSTSGRLYSYGYVPLYLQGASNSGYLNLFLKAPADSGSANSYLNLFLDSHMDSASNSVDLYIYGSSGSGTTGIPLNNSIDLYISGEGVIENAGTASSQMNLYLQAPPGAENWIPLYISGPSGTNSSINLFMNGVTGIASSGLNLYTLGWEHPSGTIPLYLRGYINYG